MNKEQRTELKIIFMGTPGFGAIILEGLIKNNYKPALVITAPDKPVGRKQILTPPLVKIIAQKYEIPVEQPKKVLNYKLQATRMKPDLIIIAAYGEIIPKEILEIPKHGCLNVHPSLLPKYRGPSPIQTIILNGDKETGTTIILIDEKMDHGPIITNRQLPISDPKITTDELSKELAVLSIDLLVEIIPKWINGEIKARPQDKSKATYTKIIKKEDGKINWKKSAIEIERQIRAFYPWPGTFTFWKGKRIKILKAETSKTAPENNLAIKCGKDYLIIKKLQPEGKKPIEINDFLRGHPDFINFIPK